MKQICQSVLSIAPNIKQALHNHLPIVALESTIISHGMPYPQNKQCAFSIENQVKKHGAIPATVAIIDGKIKVGLSEQQIERLAYEGPRVKKVSRRDLPIVLMQKSLGATTVSSTMIAAGMAGIDTFVTGGIGGVHRGYEHTLDASADLRELGQTAVTVISAGVKSILDIPRTLEYLETEGVPVVTYGSEWFPAFFSASSGIRSPNFMNSTLDIAKVMFEKQKLGLRNGMLVAVPNCNPAEGQMIEKAIQQALKQADQQGIKGAKITPFLLKRVNELTKGQSLKSNISLVHNNAEVGSKIAVDLAKLKEESRKNYPLTRDQMMGFFSSSSSTSCASKSSATCSKEQRVRENSNWPKPKGKVIVIGASAIDTCYRPLRGQKFELYKSCRGYSTRHIGGIGRNIAEVCARLQTPTTLISPLGNDEYSKMIMESCSKLKIDLRRIHSPKYPTASYLTVMDDQNDQMIGISQMEINNQLTFDNIYDSYFRENTSNPHSDIVIVDANANNDERNLQHLHKLLKFLNDQGYFVIYECKGKKTFKISDPNLLKYVSLLRMNKAEYDELFKCLALKGNKIQQTQKDAYLSKIIGSQRKNQLTPVRSLITNKGQSIKLVLNDSKVEYVPVVKCQNIVKSTGAGDTLTGALVSILLRGKSTEQSLKYAMQASRLSLETKNTQSVISDQISLERLQQMMKVRI